AERPVGLLADDYAQRRAAGAYIVELGGADEVIALVEDPEGCTVGALRIGAQQALEQPQRHAVRGRAVEMGDLGVAEMTLQPPPVGVGELFEGPQSDPAKGRPHDWSLLRQRNVGSMI